MNLYNVYFSQWDNYGIISNNADMNAISLIFGL
jgi:hypothetical protein